MTAAQVVIAANHGHALAVTKRDMLLAETKTYQIQGDAFHVHDVTITASQFRSLARHRTVIVTSSVAEGHQHQVILVVP